MGKAEHTVEKALTKAVEEIGGITRKWTSPGRIGVPDQIVIFNGIIAFVEVKTITGKLSSVQEREIARLKEKGAIVRVIYGKKDIEPFIEWLHNLYVGVDD